MGSAAGSFPQSAESPAAREVIELEPATGAKVRKARPTERQRLPKPWRNVDSATLRRLVSVLYPFSPAEPYDGPQQ